MGYSLCCPSWRLPLARRRSGAAEELRQRCGLDLHGLLEEPVEEQAAVIRAATVEAERELVQVVIELLRANGALVGTEQPALQQRGDDPDGRVA